MSNRLRKSGSVPSASKKPSASTAANVRWESRILLRLEGEDPKLLDKETAKVYRKIDGTGASIQGPVPLPVRQLSADRTRLGTDRVHRRLFCILFPTEKTVALLDKLALSGAVRTSISVEEVPAGGGLQHPDE